MTKILKNINDKYFNVMSICILTICCFTSLFWQWFSVFVIAFSIFCFVFCDTETSLGVTVFLIPFHNVLRIANITLVVYLIYISFFVLTFFKLAKNKELTFNKTILIIILAILVYSLLPFGTYKMIRWRWLSTFFIIIGTCYILKQLIGKIEFSKVLYCLLLGLAVSSLFRGLLDSGAFVRKFQLNNISYRFEALMINPNYFSEACAMICASLLVLLYKNKNVIFSSICFVVSLCLGVSTKSKSFLLLSVIFITIFLIYFLRLAVKKKNVPLQILIYCSFIIGIILTIFFMQSRINFNNKINLTQLLSNRNTIWKMALKELTENPTSLIFGLGIGSEIRWEQAQTCHSVYLEILQKFGIFGTAIFLTLTIYCLVLLFKKYDIKQNLINLLPVVTLAIYSLTDTIIFPATSMMIFPLCLVSLFVGLEKNDKSNTIKQSK